MRREFGSLYVWKSGATYRACFILKNSYPSYLVLNPDRNITRDEINKKIHNWVELGYKLKIGKPPENIGKYYE